MLFYVYNKEKNKIKLCDFKKGGDGKLFKLFIEQFNKVSTLVRSNKKNLKKRTGIFCIIMQDYL